MEPIIEPVFEFELPVDPSTLCTAQQKKVSFKHKRIFTNPKVLRGEKVIALLAMKYRTPVRSALGNADGIRLEATYFYPYPKGTPKKRLVDNGLKTNGADLDNVHKSVQDALGPGNGKSFKGAGFWDDDRIISTLVLRKRYTTKSPRIEFAIGPDVDGSEIFEKI